MTKRRKFSHLKRTINIRPPKRKFILFSEGSKTEKDYFYALGEKFGETLVEIKFTGGVGDPKTIAKQAIEEIEKLPTDNSFECDDEVWAVFDRDTHHHYDVPIEQCESNGVQVARSNPCFELWLILHIEDYDKACTHHTLQNDLSKICPEYRPRKNKTVDCERIISKVINAETRAKVLLRKRREEGNPFGPPSTTVGKLTANIRSASRRHKK